MNPDTALFAGFLGAIQSYSQALEGNSALQKLTLGHRTLHVRKSSNPALFLVAEADLKKEKDVQKRLQKVDALFNERYPPSFVAGWNGDPHAFEDFQGEVEKLFVPAVD
ncbi:MAG: hypothetical protein ACTSU5_17880 [Promethearchaeota archaeon]